MANLVAAPDITTATNRVAATPIPLTPTVYYYRTGAGGARGSTNNKASIPANSLIEAIETT
jgi:hypothetical protein